MRVVEIQFLVVFDANNECNRPKPHQTLGLAVLSVMNLSRDVKSPSSTPAGTHNGDSTLR